MCHSVLCSIVGCSFCMDVWISTVWRKSRGYSYIHRDGCTWLAAVVGRSVSPAGIVGYHESVCLWPSRLKSAWKKKLSVQSGVGSWVLSGVTAVKETKSRDVMVIPGASPSSQLIPSNHLAGVTSTGETREEEKPRIANCVSTSSEKQVVKTRREDVRE